MSLLQPLRAVRAPAPLRSSLRQYATAAPRAGPAPRRLPPPVRRRNVGVPVTLAILTVGGAAAFFLSPSAHADAAVAVPLSATAAAALQPPVLPATTRREPATGTELPLTLTLDALPRTRLHLVGLGARSVSFLSIRVYVAGVYIEERALPLVAKLTRDGRSTEDVAREVLRAGHACVVRIVPVRSTDMSHLRDGFLRSLSARAKSARAAHALTEADELSLEAQLEALRAVFPKHAVPKGDALDLVFANKTLDVRWHEERLGRVRGPRGEKWTGIAELLLAYVADKSEISRPIKDSVVEGFAHIAKTGAAATA
ncbi:hypothetical protein FA09DRAFT_327783 [Tilletiopsis washingtonensis]|uniref:Chalcone isomerase domain-containing protein n=1 Tax=Tilletiopsis washingtonensis TaxID=58919 RepID=A0A316ZGZ7_9BASI|nr:hypothetical protein FA09DRAFT_327783 [Tilletiopsis washingtonensis]PWO00329.1 hypothetical protein FA09DRAFT_327783 [Tilletiopsis washingtonensis]